MWTAILVLITTKPKGDALMLAGFNFPSSIACSMGHEANDSSIYYSVCWPEVHQSWRGDLESTVARDASLLEEGILWLLPPTSKAVWGGPLGLDICIWRSRPASQKQKEPAPKPAGAPSHCVPPSCTLWSSAWHTVEQALAYPALYLVGEMKRNDAEVVEEAAGQQVTGELWQPAQRSSQARLASSALRPDMDAGSSAEPACDLHAGYAKAHTSIKVEPVHPPAAHGRRLGCACS